MGPIQNEFLLYIWYECWDDRCGRPKSHKLQVSARKGSNHRQKFQSSKTVDMVRQSNMFYTATLNFTFKTFCLYLVRIL